MQNVIVNLWKMNVLCAVLFLFSACGNDADLSDPRYQTLISAIDERSIPDILPFLHDKQETFRAQAALGFGSFADSSIVDTLLAVLRNDESADVRASAAFSIGQCAAFQARKPLIQSFRNENDKAVRSEVLKAIGKCGDGAWLSQQKDSVNESLFPALAEGLFYAVRSKRMPAPSVEALLFLLKRGEDETGFYAASALSRINEIPVADASQLIKSLELYAEESTRSAIFRCIGKCGSGESGVLQRYFRSEENYLVRLAILRSVTGWKPDSAAAISRLGMEDKNPHIRETAAGNFLSNSNSIRENQRLAWAKKETAPRTKFMLIQSVMKTGSIVRKDSLSKVLRKQLGSERDEYIQGYILKALAEDFSNFEMLEELTFTTTSILIREYGFEALIQLRSSSLFPVFATDWQRKTNSPIRLDQYFGKLIRNAIETHDVSLVAIAAAFLRDTTLSGHQPGKIPVPYPETGFMRDALEALKLPRDIESYGELLKTIRFYEGKSTEGQLKPDFNNPIDWTLVQRIPTSQKIRIHTSEGTMDAELWVKDAPGTVGRFVSLIQDSFYMNKRIHRVVPGFVVQDGCPRGDGFGSTMETIRLEVGNRNFEAGTLGMASAGPDTESCQWFITHTRTPHLNGRYTAFGQVTSGIEVLHSLLIGARIERIELVN